MSASSSMTRMRPRGAAMREEFSDIHRFSRQREMKMESGSLTGCAHHFNGAIVLANDAVGNGEAKAGPLSRGLGGEKGIVDARQVFGRDAFTRIGHFDDSQTVATPRSNAQRTAVFHSVAGVEDEVQEHLLHFTRVTADSGKTGFGVKLDMDRGVIELVLEQR